MNLIVNAAEAVVGNGEIVITTQQVVRHQPGGSAPRACAQLTVRDDGAGISPASIADVFESGYSTKTADHSGLGLATVHQIVEHFKGSIELETSTHAGTSIRIYLPLCQDRRRRPAHRALGIERRALVVVDGGATRTARAEERVRRRDCRCPRKRVDTTPGTDDLSEHWLEKVAVGVVGSVQAPPR